MEHHSHHASQNHCAQYSLRNDNTRNHYQQYSFGVLQLNFAMPNTRGLFFCYAGLLPGCFPHVSLARDNIIKYTPKYDFI